MVSICKIKRFILWGMFFTHSFGCVGQNVYNSKTIYYNRDTIWCVDKDDRIREGDKTKFLLDNYEKPYLYCEFKKNIDIPIVTVNDDNIIHLIDSCINTALRSNDLQYPDSSGFFVELLIYDKRNDSLTLGIEATSYRNYIMANVLKIDLNDILNEWFGYNAKDVHGCFFRNDILCIVTSLGNTDYKRASCHFSDTQDSLRLVLFSPIIWAIPEKQSDYYQYYYYFNECNSIHQSAQE